MNYEKILQNIIELKSDELNDWESSFCDSLMSQEYPFTENQEKQILKLNRKYLVMR